jgi:antitoxin HigA-1
MKKIMRSLRNPSRRPTHPGAILREDVLPELDITQAAFANHLGVSRLTVPGYCMKKEVLVPRWP